jgi:hypothetical protein
MIMLEDATRTKGIYEEFPVQDIAEVLLASTASPTPAPQR